MSEQMAFESEIHRELFQAFISKFIETNRYLDLFPREIHQERVEHEGWYKEIASFDKKRIKFYFTDDNKQEG